MSGGITTPPLGIFVEEGASVALKQHEYGHFLQYRKMGAVNYYMNVALPSIINEAENKLERALFGRTVFSVPHFYYRTETNANSQSQSFFGNGAPISSWPGMNSTRRTPFSFPERLSLYLFFISH